MHMLTHVLHLEIETALYGWAQNPKMSVTVAMIAMEKAPPIRLKKVKTKDLAIQLL